MGDFSALNDLDGLQFIPVNDKKMPLVKDWQTTITKHNLSNCYGVGLVCGVPSGNVELLDLDIKYDITGKLWEQFRKTVHGYAEGLLEKLVVQKTKNGGYHCIYRCSKLEGNLKLANRPTTEEERKETYDRAYADQVSKSKSDEEAKKFAQKSSDNDKVRVLIETRGIGGQAVVAPTSGYEFIYGDICSITEITPDERDTLHGISRQFNQVIEEVPMPRQFVPDKRYNGISPFEDYDNRGDVVQLLEANGWTFVKNKGQKTLLLRPGQTSAESSGNYDFDKRWFSVFTTSTEFEPQKAYRPYAVYAILECKKDFSEASKRLYDLGYGDRREEKGAKEKAPSTREIQSRISLDDNDLSFLAEDIDWDGYIQQVIDGTLPQGLSTGIPSLDEYFLFKEAAFVNINGIDNVGKSVVLWYLLLLAAMYHGWQFVIFSSENTIGGFMRKMIQFYWGKPLRGEWAMKPEQVVEAKLFIKAHFKIIKAQEDLFNYKDIINMVKKSRVKYPNLKAGLIDPYNSLKVNLSGFSKLNTHEYHYEALSEMKAYGQQTNFGWFINHHAVTAAARQKDAEKKYPMAPNKADTEGGQKTANKSDEFLTIHRITQHPSEWMVTEIHVRKVKDTETGGKPTPLDMPVKLELYKGGTAFKERLEMGGYPKDPIQEWHMRKEGVQQPLQFAQPLAMQVSVNNLRMPYAGEPDEIPEINF
jgi:hypothetical protein